jgi:hypothetical protein
LRCNEYRFQGIDTQLRKKGWHVNHEKIHRICCKKDITYVLKFLGNMFFVTHRKFARTLVIDQKQSALMVEVVTDNLHLERIIHLFASYFGKTVTIPSSIVAVLVAQFFDSSG